MFEQKQEEEKRKQEQFSEALTETTEGPVNNVLEKGLVRLVKKTYLEALARDKKPLPRHQEIPESEFASTTEAIDALERGKIIAISYGWLSPGHPDPDGFYLKFFSERSDVTPFGRRAEKYEEAWGQEYCPAFLFFWDWASLPQEPRNEEEKRNFKEALYNMHFIYGHAKIKVWILDCVPEDAENNLSLDLRGWPLFEKQVANSKPTPMWRGWINGAIRVIIQYIHKYRADSWAPLTPADFSREITHRKFSGTGDQGKVCHLYKDFWNGHLCHMEEFHGSSGNWDNTRVAMLICVIPELPYLGKVEIGPYDDISKTLSIDSEWKKHIRNVCFPRGIRVKVWNSLEEEKDAKEDFHEQWLNAEKFGINVEFPGSFQKITDEAYLSSLEEARSLPRLSL